MNAFNKELYTTYENAVLWPQCSVQVKEANQHIGVQWSAIEQDHDIWVLAIQALRVKGAEIYIFLEPTDSTWYSIWHAAGFHVLFYTTTPKETAELLQLDIDVWILGEEYV